MDTPEKKDDPTLRPCGGLVMNGVFIPDAPIAGTVSPTFAGVYKDSTLAEKMEARQELADMDTPESKAYTATDVWWTEASIWLNQGGDVNARKDELIARASKTSEEAFKTSPGGTGLLRFSSFVHDAVEHRALVRFSFTPDPVLGA